MPLFRRRESRSTTDSSGLGAPFSFDPKGPDSIASHAQDLYGHQHFAEALEEFGRAVDLLQTLYVFEKMRQRQPSAADTWIIDGYTSALGATLAVNAQADVTESVRTTTHRLRTISTAAQRVGAPAQLYLDGLDLMRQYAPRVNVDDILWS